MAKIYCTPEHLPEPEFSDFDVDNRFDFNAYDAALKAHTQRLAEWCKSYDETDSDPCVGEVVRWPVADGYAQYMVLSMKRLALIHLDYVDGYRVDPIMERGMRVSDIRAKVKQHKAMDELFGRSTHTLDEGDKKS